MTDLACRRHDGGSIRERSARGKRASIRGGLHVYDEDRQPAKAIANRLVLLLPASKASELVHSFSVLNATARSCLREWADFKQKRSYEKESSRSAAAARVS
jgi:hypothetical protein